MKVHVPMIQCDGDSGLCGEMEIDHYETGASAIDGHPLTNTNHLPGWVTSDDGDYCPDCKTQTEHTDG